MRRRMDIVVFLWLVGTTCLALDHPGGYIETNQTWYAADNPHRVLGNIYVRGELAPVLTIEPGCSIEFEQGTVLVIGAVSTLLPGTLIADGGISATPTIFFTAPTGSPAGHWEGIRFVNSAGTSSILRNCAIRYAGAGFYNTAVYCSIGYPIIDGCEISYSSGSGLSYWDSTGSLSTPTITNTTMSNNLSYPLKLYGQYLASIGTGNEYLNNASNQIYVFGDLIETDVTLVRQSVPFRIGNYLAVRGGAGATLTLPEGTTFLFETDGYLRIGDINPLLPGALYIQDQLSDQPVVLSSAASSPQPGDWQGLIFERSTVVANCRINNLTVRYGGSSSSSYQSSIYHNLVAPVIERCVIEYSGGYGIRYGNFPTAITTPSINNCQFNNNQWNPIYVYANHIPIIGSGNTFLNNGRNRILTYEDVIEDSLTWLNLGIPYEISGLVSVRGAASIPANLTIQSGTQILFAANAQFVVGTVDLAAPASLYAVNVLFGSAAPSPAPGDWKGIQFERSTVSASSELRDCTIEYGGGSDGTANVTCIDCSPTIVGCTLSHSGHYGLYLNQNAGDPGNPVATCTFTGNLTYPIFVYTSKLDAVGLTNTYSSNGKNRLHVYSQVIDSTRTIYNPGVPLEFTGSLHITSPCGGVPITVTISPGLGFYFPETAMLRIGTIGTGCDTTLIAQGSSSARITFSSALSTPYNGSWVGIVFEDSVVDSATVLDYCTIAYGGSGTNNACVTFLRSSPIVKNSRIQRSSGYGLYLDSNSGNTLIPNIVINEVSYCSGYPIYIHTNRVPAIGSSNTFSNNSINRIKVIGARLATDLTFARQAVNYEIEGVLDVRGTAGTPVTLTINPGAQLRFGSGSYILVGSDNPLYPGILSAVGTSSQTIRFTSAYGTQQPGDWPGLIFNNYASDSSILSYCRVEYAGGDTAQSGILCIDSSPDIIDTSVRQSAYYGVRYSGSGVTTDAHVAGSSITSNRIGVYCENNAQPLLTDGENHYNTFRYNTTAGVQNTSAPTVDARYNWWGNWDCTGPGGDAPGTGDAVYGNVLWDPFVCPPTPTPTPTATVSPTATITPTPTITPPPIPSTDSYGSGALLVVLGFLLMALGKKRLTSCFPYNREG